MDAPIVLTKKMTYYEKNRERIIEYQRKYYEKNQLKISEYNQNYYKNKRRVHLVHKRTKQRIKNLALKKKHDEEILKKHPRQTSCEVDRIVLYFY